MKTTNYLAVSLLMSALCANAWEGVVDGGRLACDYVADGIVRVQYSIGDKLESNGTGVIPAESLKSKAESRMSDVECPAGTIRLDNGDLAVEIDKASGRVVFKDAVTGRVLLAESANNPHAGKRVNTDKVVYDEKSARTEHTANGDIVVKDVLSRKKGEETTQYQVRFDWRKDESLYGLGQHIEDYLDLRGKEQFLTQHNLKVTVPVLVSTAGYGLLFDAGSAMRFDDRDGAGLFEIKAAKELDYYFIKGPRLDDVIARYRKLTGECPMLPRYVFGYVQSKERYHSSDEIIATLKRYRDLGVPIDVIVQDWNYWPQGWGYMKMDPKHYPDRPALAKGVHDLNGHLMVSIWPNPQYCPQEKDFRDRGFMRPNNVYDAFNPAARDLYWKYANDEFFSCGFDAWWCDCSEPVDADWKVMPDGYGLDNARERWEKNSEMLSDTLGAERSSLFSLYHARGIYEHQRAATDRKRVVNLTRSSFAGQQRYSTITWNGDMSADWASFKRQIPSGLNFMASGTPYWTVDAGCFFVGERGQWFWKGKFPQGVKDAAYREYYVRMLEWAAYLPMFRSHGTDTPREIWNFGERGTPHFDAIEKTIRGRYELLPYIYSVAAKVSQEGYTMARLLAFDFPDDRKVRDMKDEFMFGPSLLVAPVTDPGVSTRWVYLPEFKTPDGANGAWFDCRSGMRYAAGTDVNAPAPLDSIPVFQKAGSIVVKGPVTMYADAQRGLPLEVVVAPGFDAEFALYDDEGDNYDYEKGSSSTVRIAWNEAAGELTFGKRSGAAPGQPERQKFHVRVIGRGDADVDYTGERLTVRIASKPAARHFNPIVPDWVADPSICKFGDTFYLYGTTDIDKELSRAGVPVVWRSKDFVNWSFEGPAMTGIKWGEKDGPGWWRYWAPGKVVEKDGKYLLYVTIVSADGKRSPTRVFEADNPAGPWDFNAGKDVAPDIDGDPFVDDDGRAYLVWRCRKAAALDETWKATTGPHLEFRTNRGGYSEGPCMFKRGGIYYYLYTIGGCDGYCYAYMMSKEGPLSGWTAPEGYDGVIETHPGSDVWGPGHGNVFADNGRHYITYLEYGEGGTTRQVFANAMDFNDDGTIRLVVPDRAGVGYLGPNQETRENIAPRAKWTASSVRPSRRVGGRTNGGKTLRISEYEPSAGADDDNGTRWVADGRKDGEGKSWIECDFGADTPVDEVKMFFTIPAFGHSWRLEGCTDGGEWFPVAEELGKPCRSPHVAKVGKNVRKLRLSILAGDPGLWEFKIYK